MTRRTFAIALLAIFTAGVAMRVAWLRADPPSTDAVGIVWHDEGAWVHNARNRALWGVWRTDAWNPVFVAPVFTALEYGSFRAFGVGLWQARVVPVASGLAALAALMVGLSALGGRRAAAIGGALLATNYAFVMWNRAALMESTMTMWMTIAWAAYAAAPRRPGAGVIAGAAAAAAWFTKASAACFVAALVADAAWAAIARAFGLSSTTARDRDARVAAETLVGLAVAGAVIAAAFVLPHWTEYRFYNWQMSVTRKPAYTLRALVDRASWLPLVEGIFTHMWLVVACAAVAIVGVVARWREARPAERLLVLWIAIGLAELVVHDSGNERRYVMFIPAFSALAALLASRAWREPWPADAAPAPWRRLGPASLFVLIVPLGYLVAGSLVRPALRARIDAGDLHDAVWISAALAVAAAASVALGRRPIARWLRAHAHRAPAAVALWLAAILGSSAVEYAAWAARRSDANYEASVALGRLLPPGTLVQGKLANGMALESRIRPLFVGNGFGNYEDRLRRDDARYILTYDLPRIGYESSDGSGLIDGILDHYPHRRVVARFVVDETPDPDRAVLIDKNPAAAPAHATH